MREGSSLCLELKLDVLDPFDRHPIRILPPFILRLIPSLDIPLVLIKPEERDSIERGTVVDARPEGGRVRVDRWRGLGRRPTTDSVRRGGRGWHLGRGGHEDGHAAEEVCKGAERGRSLVIGSRLERERDDRLTPHRRGQQPPSATRRRMAQTTRGGTRQLPRHHHPDQQSRESGRSGTPGLEYDINRRS